MSDSTGVTAPPFRAGSVLGQSFSILFRNIVPFGLLALLFTVPAFVFNLVDGPPPPEDGFGASIGYNLTFDAIGISAFIIELLTNALLSAVLVYGTFQTLLGRSAGLSENLSRGLASILPVAGAAIIYTVATIVGLGFLIVPGLIIATMFWVVIPAAVIERPGLFASFARSRVLTKGSRWRIFGLFVLLLIINIIFGIVIAAAAASIDGDDKLSGPILGWLASAFASALWAIASAVAYHDLRLAKEGGDTAQIAAVFD